MKTFSSVELRIPCADDERAVVLQYYQSLVEPSQRHISHRPNDVLYPVSVLEVFVSESWKGGVSARTGIEIKMVFFRGKARLFRPPPGVKREQP